MMEEKDLKQLEDKLWASADKMRGAVSVSDYKFIVYCIFCPAPEI